MDWPKLIVFILANFVMTLSLFWGLRTIIDIARHQNILQEALSEKTFTSNNSGGAKAKPGSVGSFSRIAGAFGSIALAVAVIGVSYWLIYTLFYGNMDNLDKLKEAGWFFLSGSALFAPYAFNQLSSVFKLPNISRDT